MKGLILKDFINLKRNAKVIVIMAAIYFMMSFAMEGSTFFGSMFTLVFAMFFLSTYSFDELAKWDGYALTMPVSKSDMVQSKYMVMLLLAAIGLVVSCMVQLVLNVLTKAGSPLEGLQFNIIATSLVVLFYSVTIPFITKLGIEKARFIFIMVYMIPFFLGTIGFKALKERYPEPPETLIKLGKAFIDNVYIILPLVVLIALWISYSISIRIYQKKEF